jgi:flagellar basal body-associated protein FliL
MKVEIDSDELEIIAKKRQQKSEIGKTRKQLVLAVLIGSGIAMIVAVCLLIFLLAIDIAPKEKVWATPDGIELISKNDKLFLDGQELERLNPHKPDWYQFTTIMLGAAFLYFAWLIATQQYESKQKQKDKLEIEAIKTGISGEIE